MDPHNDERTPPFERSVERVAVVAVALHLDKSRRLRAHRLEEGLLRNEDEEGSFSQATDMHAATSHEHTIEDAPAAAAAAATITFQLS